jgi:predicted site-specific integrase-resolvase
MPMAVKIWEVFVENQKTVFNMEEAMEFTGLSRSYLYKASRRGVLSCYKPTNGRLIFKKQDLETFLFRNQKGAVKNG